MPKNCTFFRDTFSLKQGPSMQNLVLKTAEVILMCKLLVVALYVSKTGTLLVEATRHILLSFLRLSAQTLLIIIAANLMLPVHDPP